MQPIKVTHRKLGKFKAIGLAWKESRHVEVDSRLKGIDHLQVLIHELLHVQNPTWSEIKVEGHSAQLAQILFENGYRKIDIV